MVNTSLLIIEIQRKWTSKTPSRSLTHSFSMSSLSLFICLQSFGWVYMYTVYVYAYRICISIQYMYMYMCKVHHNMIWLIDCFICGRTSTKIQIQTIVLRTQNSKLFLLSALLSVFSLSVSLCLSVSQQKQSMSGGIARGRLAEERKSWRKNHPHVSIYVYYTYSHVCVYVCVDVCMYMFSMHICVCMYVYMTHPHFSVRVCLYVCMYVYV